MVLACAVAVTWPTRRVLGCRGGACVCLLGSKNANVISVRNIFISTNGDYKNVGK